ncbi:hypothetical protein AALP_AA3G352800 [Arabis alpina]|uniref:Uncharacterized protein n=1 Tax=Arabis alpina TaxID=50452 RepID=A0A087HDR7_ARAAL|nr:hypothetical protein AALP_AA3G352800 [Arabis alpina]
MDSSLDGAASESSVKKIGEKRRRKNTNPSRYVAQPSVHASRSTNSAKTKGNVTIYCKNMACHATMTHGDLFCKRCSCCICYNYDANKDPSLWLICNSDPPFVGESCGLSCHLDCVFKSEKSGLKEDTPTNDADGCFYCVPCGKRNSLLECWKTQLVIAKETRKVDELCCRLVLAQKLLKGTKKYIKISETVEKAVKSLETEMTGPLISLPSAMCRGIVNRLRCTQEVKDHCASALKLLEDTPLGSTKIRLEDVHATEYYFDKVATDSPQEVGEEATFVDFLSTKEEEEEEEKELYIKEVVPENAVNGENTTSCGFELEHCVKIIRHLELSGHIKKSFREKFLTWYSLRATAQEVKIVKAFINVLKDDSVALADQLVDTFSECISRKRSAIGGGDGGGVN